MSADITQWYSLVISTCMAVYYKFELRKAILGLYSPWWWESPEPEDSYFVSSEEKWSFLDSFFCSEGGFFLPVSIFRSRGNFFSRGTREKKYQGTEIGQREEKTLPKSRKKEAKICTTFRNEVQKTIYLLVVYKRGFSTEFSF